MHMHIATQHHPTQTYIATNYRTYPNETVPTFIGKGFVFPLNVTTAKIYRSIPTLRLIAATND